MKNLFKVLVVVLIAVFAMPTQAQVKFGLKAGLNAANIAQSFEESDWEFETKMRASFHIGVTADVGFSDLLSLQTGLLYSNKGFSYDLEDDLLDGESVEGYDRVSLSYLEVPIHLAVKISGFQIYAGPYVAIGIAGKNKWDYTYSSDGGEFSDADEMKMKPIFGDIGEGDLEEDESAYSALDMGLDFGIGYQVGPVLINAGYSLGLGNLTPGVEDSDFDPKDQKVSNRVINLSVSFFFGQ